MHDGRYSNQNLGNRLGSRPSVRLSETYRIRESGNAIKQLMGSNDLLWLPEHYNGSNRSSLTSQGESDLFAGQGGGIVKVTHLGKARDTFPSQRVAGVPRASRIEVAQSSLITQALPPRIAAEDNETDVEPANFNRSAPRFSLDGYMRPGQAPEKPSEPPAGVSAKTEKWELNMRKKAQQIYAVPPYATEQVIVSPEATAAILNARDAAIRQAKNSDIFGMPKRTGKKFQNPGDPYAGNGVAACLGAV